MISIIIFLCVILIILSLWFICKSKRKRTVPCEIARQCKGTFVSKKDMPWFLYGHDGVWIQKENSDSERIMNNDSGDSERRRANSGQITSNNSYQFLDYNFYKSKRIVPRVITINEQKEVLLDNKLIFTFGTNEIIKSAAIDSGCFAVATKVNLENRLYYTDNYVKKPLKQIIDNKFPNINIKLQDRNLFVQFSSICIY